MKLSGILSTFAVVVTLMASTSCSDKKFDVSGNITDAKDSLLYFENMSLNGAVVVDSVRLDEDGSFDFSVNAPEAPEFYRLRIANQIINIAADSIGEVAVKASYPTMATDYEVTGSDDCSKIKELAIRQMALQANINGIIANRTLDADHVRDSIRTVLAVYKEQVKNDYIFKEPMRAYSYFALFQTVALGYDAALIFNPRSNEDDVKVFAAVATSWDTYYPKAERGLNLHNIAIEGLKVLRHNQAKRYGPAVDADKIEEVSLLNISLPDNKGQVRSLTELKGQVVLLDFHVFSSPGSTERIMMLREIYNKYHQRGLQVYQIGFDSDIHFWKTQTAALPWISVHDADGASSPNISKYNVSEIPTFFLIDRTNTLHKRDAQIKDLDKEIESLL